MKATNRLFALLTLKCPRCYKGNMFTHANMYVWKKSYIMPESCSCCDQPMEPETGFYYGAMYVSYALYVAVFAPTFFITVYFDFPYLEFLILFTILTIALSPYFFRLSRACYLYIFVKYDKDKARCKH